MDHILIVDDVRTDRELLGKVVQEAGFTPVYATDGEEAVGAAKQYKPRMIFMDVVMPKINGYTACRQLKNDSETKNIPVVFVTSKNNDSDRFWSQKQGGSDQVGKPFAKERILEVINKYAR